MTLVGIVCVRDGEEFYYRGLENEWELTWWDRQV